MALDRRRRLKGIHPDQTQTGLGPRVYSFTTPDCFVYAPQFAYADDLVLLHSSGKWKDLEGTLSQDMSTLSAYLQTWWLKLSHTKTVTTAFHLNNREAKRDHVRAKGLQQR